MIKERPSMESMAGDNVISAEMFWSVEVTMVNTTAIKARMKPTASEGPAEAT
jgi:hypothetical protein